MNILDLPLDRQREIASRHGLSLAAWQKEMRESNARFKAVQDRLDAGEGVRPDEATEEDIDRFQARIDSGNP